MKFSISDLLITATGTVVVAAFSFFYYKDITTRVQAGNNEVVGSITYKRKTAERKYTGQVIWEDVDHDMPVYNYDSIRTAGESEALVRLKDGTEIKLNENSMILLSLSKNQIEVDFNQGSISASRGGEGSLQKLNIKSGNTSVSIDKSDVKLSQNKTGDLNLSVLKGKAAIDTGKGVSNVGTDQAVIIGKDSKDVMKSETDIKLIDPAPDTYQLTASGNRFVDFSWQAVRGKGNVYFELSGNDLFSNIIHKKEIRGNAFRTQLARGIYYWRIRAQNKKTGKQEFSESRRFTVLWDQPVNLLAPENNEIIGYKNTIPVINFRWTKSEIASGYKLVIASDPAMNNVIKSFDAPENYFSQESLTKGIYYWRVEKVTGMIDIPKTSPSYVNKFEIRETRVIAPPELLYPENGKQFSTLLLKKQNIAFTWKNSPEIREYNFSVSKDDKFDSQVFQGNSKVNFIQLAKDLPKGKYYWRITGKLDSKEETPPSPAWAFSIIETEDISLIMPEKNASISPEDNERTASVRFSWKQSEIKGRYKLHISRQQNFSSMYKETVVESGTSTAVQLEPGKYFWKVILADEKDAILANSTPQAFSVENNLGTPVVITPKDGNIINMGDKNNLSFMWNRVQGANLYRLTLYGIKKGKEYRITEFEDSGTTYKITDLRKLDESNYSWTLQAFEISGKNKEAIKKSPVIRNNFKVTLGKPVEKVDVHSLKIENL